MVPPDVLMRWVPAVATIVPKPQVSVRFGGFAIAICAGMLSVTAAAVSGTRELLKNEMRNRLMSPGSTVAGVNCLLTVTVAYAAGAARTPAAAARAKATTRAAVARRRQGRQRATRTRTAAWA